jgi:hypothetical protein
MRTLDTVCARQRSESSGNTFSDFESRDRLAERGIRILDNLNIFNILRRHRVKILSTAAPIPARLHSAPF